MALSKIDTNAIADDAIDNTKLDLTSNYAFTGTITGTAVNTPAFAVKKSGDQSISSGAFTKVTFETEIYDTDNAFASNKFTVPTGEGGKYHFTVHPYVYNIDAASQVETRLYKNGSALGSSSLGSSTHRFYSSATNQEVDKSASFTFELSAGDYIEVYIMQNNSTTETIYNYTKFTGFKLIE